MAQQQQQPQQQQLRWRTDLPRKSVLTSNFEARGWLPAAASSDDEGGWDLYWASTATVQQLFAPGSHVKLRPGQLVSHFPNHYELTAKDLLVKNLNRYRRRLRRAGQAVPAIMPATFVLPQDLSLFVEEFKKQPDSSTFILKPARKAQGKGIFLINRLSQLKAVQGGGGSSSGSMAAAEGAPRAAAALPAVFLPSRNNASASASQRSAAQSQSRPAMEDYVVQRYIQPLLLPLCGNKFDLRLYVLVPSFDPLMVYLSSLGFARFSNARYEVAELDNLQAHLTNVAVQKGGGAYNSSHGNKWPLHDLRLHLEATHGHAATAQVFEAMQQLVVHTLKAVQPVMISEKGCFELYGFDLMLDECLTPWLLEVNASPSLSTTTAADRLLKWQVVHDALSIVVPPSQPAAAPAAAPGTPASPMHPSSGSSSRHASARSPVKTPSKKAVAPRRTYPAAAGCMQLIHHDQPPSSSRERRKPGSKSSTAAAGGAAAGGGKQRHVFLHG